MAVNLLLRLGFALAWILPGRLVAVLTAGLGRAAGWIPGRRRRNVAANLTVDMLYTFLNPKIEL